MCPRRPQDSSCAARIIIPTDPRPKVPADGPWSDFLGPGVARKLLPMSERRIRVAVIDDDPSVRRALQRILKVMDVSVDGYASGEEFLASLQQQQPRSEEHTSELQSLMRISYSVF